MPMWVSGLAPSLQNFGTPVQIWALALLQVGLDNHNGKIWYGFFPLPVIWKINVQEYASPAKGVDPENWIGDQGLNLPQNLPV